MKTYLYLLQGVVLALTSASSMAMLDKNNNGDDDNNSRKNPIAISQSKKDAGANSDKQNQQKKPVVASSQQKKPVVASSQQKKPVVAFSQQKKPIVAFSQQKKPVVAFSQQKQQNNGEHLPIKSPLFLNHPEALQKEALICAQKPIKAPLKKNPYSLPLKKNGAQSTVVSSRKHIVCPDAPCYLHENDPRNVKIDLDAEMSRLTQKYGKIKMIPERIIISNPETN